MKARDAAVYFGAFCRMAGVDAQWKAGGPLDGQLTLALQEGTCTFEARAKKAVGRLHMELLRDLKTQCPNLLLLAGHLAPGLRAQLRQMGVPYIEANGNAWLKCANMLLFIEGQAPLHVPKDMGNRAFTKTGLKVVFHFLMDAGLVNCTQRDIAATTGVALGNIPLVIEGLTQTEYLVPLRKNDYVWQNRQGLLHRWMEAYETELKPRLKMGRFALKADWRSLALDPQTCAWGGEPAAELLANHLVAEELTLYTLETTPRLMKHYKLVPDAAGEVAVYQAFWTPNGEQPIAPPLLVYADLLIAGGKRNTETAEMIFNGWIKTKL